MRHRMRSSAGGIAAVVALALLGGCSGPGSQTGSSPRPSASDGPSAAAPASVSPSGTASAAQAGAIIRAYEFPGGMIEGAEGGGPLYTRVQGLIAVPTTPGPHATVVFIHGSYPSCVDIAQDKLLTREVLTTPWEEGCGTKRLSNEDGITEGPDYVRTPASWAYLAQTLAERGFAVVVPDVNTKERLAWGGAPDPVVLQTNLAKLHLDIARRLSAGEDLGLPFAADLTGRIDTSQTCLVGHSSGGGYVVAAALGDQIPGLKGVVAIEPNLTHTEKAVAALVPSLVIAGECDEQIALAEVLGGSKELATTNPGAVVITATLPSTTHIGLLDGGGSHKIGLVQPVRTPTCADGALLPKEVQRSQAAEMTAAFLDQVRKGGTSFTLPALSGVKVEATAQTGAATVTVAPSTAGPEAMDPHRVTYDTSSRAWLPEKPADMDLAAPDGI